MKKLVIILAVFTASCSKDLPCEPTCSSTQCTAKTQSGSRCQNMTKNCCGKCYLHI